MNDLCGDIPRILFPSQKVSNAESRSIWWYHHEHVKSGIWYWWVKDENRRNRDTMYRTRDKTTSWLRKKWFTLKDKVKQEYANFTMPGTMDMAESGWIRCIESWGNYGGAIAWGNKVLYCVDSVKNWTYTLLIMALLQVDDVVKLVQGESHIGKSTLKMINVLPIEHAASKYGCAITFHIWCSYSIKL